MILTDYNEQEHIAMEREEAKEEGFNAGLTVGISKGLSVSRDVILEFLCSIGPLPAHLKKLIENDLRYRQNQRMLRAFSKGLKKSLHHI